MIEKGIKWVGGVFLFVFALLLLVWFAKFVFGQIFGTEPTDTQSERPRSGYSDTQRGSSRQRGIDESMRRRQAEDAARTKRFEAKCDHEDASPRDWDEGGQSCHRSGRARTYVGGRLVEEY